MNAVPRLLKYAAVGRITVRNQLAYLADFLLRTVFLLAILYIFLQLWGVTFRQEGASLIAGYTYEQLIWYLILAESITMACPSLCARIEEEVKSGDIGYKLIRPMSYTLFHAAAYFGEVAVRLLVNIAVGGALGVLVFGWPDFGWGWPAFFAVAIGSVAVNYLLNMALALCAFWVEETRGLEFVYNKLLFTVGGMLLPLEIFPDWLQRICAWLPFQAVIYFASRTAVRFDAELLGRFLLIQWLWVALLAGLVALIFSLGVKKLHVNGG